MAKLVRVIADLSIQNDAGKIKVTNDEDGSLVFDFPNRQSFNKFTEIPLPFRLSLKTIGKTNAALLEQRQSVVVRVDHQDWIVLGREPKAFIKYVKLAPIYLKKQFTWKTASYLVGGILSFVLGYFVIKRQN